MTPTGKQPLYIGSPEMTKQKTVKNPYNPPKLIFALMALACASTPSFAQQECDGYRYRYTGAFEANSVVYDVPYGQNLSWDGTETELVVDIYAPVGDALAERPLVVLAHGGFFLDGSNDGLDVVSLSEDLAQMGYVVASMSYRLGVNLSGVLTGLAPIQDEFVKAVWRGVHDSKAAIRFFRKSAEEGNPYGIDPNRIYLGGVSAGAFIALHHAYVDEDSEITAQIDITESGLEGGLEGLSGNPGYSSEVQGVFNIAGALQTTDFLTSGENKRLFSIHGTEDGTVPYGEGMISLLGFNIIDVDGSSVIHAQAEELGLEHCLITVEGAGHVPHIDVLNPEYYDLTISALAGRLGKWACEDYIAFCSGYDHTAPTHIEEHSVKASPLVFPNPASAQEVIHMRFRAPSAWRLTNVMGQSMGQGYAPEGAEVELQGLPAGMYVLQTEHGRQPLVVAR